MEPEPETKYDEYGYPLVEFTEVKSYKDLRKRIQQLPNTTWLQTIIYDYEPYISGGPKRKFKKKTISKNKFWIGFYRILNKWGFYQNIRYWKKNRIKKKRSKTT